jgi:biopolymer transport protein ExbB/TolQ
MNFIFGIIILAMFILALRVIWATALQLLAMLKSGKAAINRYRVQRSAKRSLPAIMPRINHDVDWLAMSDSVRQEIHSRNALSNRQVDRLDVELQVKTKTMELINADIQIAKLQLELEKVRPAVVLQDIDSGKRTKRSKKATSLTEGDLNKSSHPVRQLRTALKSGNVQMIPANELARH